MERSRFYAALRLALGLLGASVLLYALLLSGAIAPIAPIVPTQLLATLALSCLLSCVGLLTFLGFKLWLLMRGDLVAYRVLYHAEQPPDGERIGRLLQAVARNAGSVTLVWQMHRVPAIADAQESFGALSHTTALQKTAPAETSMRGNPDSSAINAALYLVAPASARSALENVLPELLPGLWAERCEEPRLYDENKLSVQGFTAYSWRWDAQHACSGDLADPLSCGIHLRELVEGIKSRTGREPEGNDDKSDVKSLEVRLTLRSEGMAATLTSLERFKPCHALPIVDVHTGLAAETVKASQDVRTSFLRPLMWGWLTKLSMRPGSWRLLLDACASDKSAKGRFPLVLRDRLTLDVIARTAASLGAKLASRYPLWERAGAYSFAEEMQSKSKVAAPGPVDLSGPEYDGGRMRLRVPATVGDYLSLDSDEAREIAPASTYALPHLPSQVLMLGTTTRDGKPVGLPALKLSPRLSDMRSVTSKPAGADQCGTNPTLHPMLGEHVLVTGSGEAWRRAVASSLVTQALEMGMSVVSMDGGPAPADFSTEAAKRARPLSGELKPTLSKFPGARALAAPGNVNSLPHTSPLVSRSLPKGEHTIVQIDMDKPAGSVRPNLLYVDAPSSLSPVHGEAVALRLALTVALPAQLRYLQALNLAGTDVDRVASNPAELSATRGGQSTAGASLLEAWLTVLLLRHHRARLYMAARCAEDVMKLAKPALPAKPALRQPFTSSSCGMQGIPSCPELPTLAVVLGEPEMLIDLLRREHRAWGDPAWLRALGNGQVAEMSEALNTAHAALERTSSIERLATSDLYLYGATLRGQLKNLLSHRSLAHMMRAQHVSLAGFLDSDLPALVKINVSGAYGTVAAPYSEEEVARKRYGLYLLWSLWAASQQRILLKSLTLPGNGDTATKPAIPTLLMLYGAGAWFGAESPLSDPLALAGLGAESSGIGVVATVSGVDHLGVHKGAAAEAFGNLIFGPAPAVDPDASPAVHALVDAELRLLAGCMKNLAGQLVGRRVSSERLLEVRRTLGEGRALVVTRVPGGKDVCTAYVGSETPAHIRGRWSSQV